MKEDNTRLYAALEEYSRTGAYPFHMPGHKRTSWWTDARLPYGIDITEITGFDDLHHPCGIIRGCMERAAALYGSESSYILVNGSTCGILAAVSSVVHRGDSVIAARNCHKAVYNACALSELNVRYIYPDADPVGVCKSITPESVCAALSECPSAKAVIVTSPTYEGVISDIKGIAAVCRSCGAALIVDAAHGAHLPFCTFGEIGDPVRGGADIVIESLHKTLPALTQTAVAHINGGLVSRERFEKYLGVFETSSPSYVLLASVGECLAFLENRGSAFEEYEKRLGEFSERIGGLRSLRVLCHGGDGGHGFFSFDKGKLVISTARAGITGVELARRLRGEYSLELEMSYPTYALAMTSVCDGEDAFVRLADALLEIDKTLAPSEPIPFPPQLPRPKCVRMTNAELDALPDTELTRSIAAKGRYISRRCIYAYPPGIPVVLPGEIIGAEEFDYIEALKRSGVRVEGV